MRGGVTGMLLLALCLCGVAASAQQIETDIPASLARREGANGIRLFGDVLRGSPPASYAITRLERIPPEPNAIGEGIFLTWRDDYRGRICQVSVQRMRWTFPIAAAALERMGQANIRGAGINPVVHASGGVGPDATRLKEQSWRVRYQYMEGPNLVQVYETNTLFSSLDRTFYLYKKCFMLSDNPVRARDVSLEVPVSYLADPR